MVGFREVLHNFLERIAPSPETDWNEYMELHERITVISHNKKDDMEEEK